MFARTERLLLRPGWTEDAKALYQAVADANIVCHLGNAPWPYTADDAHDFTKKSHDPRYPHFFLFRRGAGESRLVGGCGLVEEDGETEMGYWITRPYWGQGYASEAVRALVNIAWSVGHRQLVASHFTDNIAAKRVLEKAGFESTGLTKMRHSEGWGHAAPCAIYRRSLVDDGHDDTIAGRYGNMPMAYPKRPIAA